jgi:glycosyltransferase involved in cell wall biosynthesis
MYRQVVQEDREPRQDYYELSASLGADIISPDSRHLALLRYSWLVEQRLKLHLVEALRVARKLTAGQLAISTSEKVGLPLAAALHLRQQQSPHLLIAHKLSSVAKARFFKMWPLPDGVQRIACVSQAQVEYAVNVLGMPAARADFVYDKVDHCFFRPGTAVSGDYILAVGQEQRDYATLLRALAGTGLRLIIVNSSSWNQQNQHLQEVDGVALQVLSALSYPALRDLYAGARLVALPLHDVNYAAGVNGALEAMSMAKPLLMSQTRGLAGYGRSGETAVTVPPADTAAWRDAILSLWDDEQERRRLGENGRQLVAEQMTMEHYLARLGQIVAEM